MLGTNWTAPHQGDDLRTLLVAFGLTHLIESGDEDRKTNIRLTGNPITEYDRRRLRCATLKELSIIDP